MRPVRIASNFTALLAIVPLIGLSACAEGGTSLSTSMQLGAPAFAPRGYLKFCERRPDQCGLPAPISSMQRAALDKTLMRQQWANVLNLRPTSTTAPSAELQRQSENQVRPRLIMASYAPTESRPAQDGPISLDRGRDVSAARVLTWSSKESAPPDEGEKALQAAAEPATDRAPSGDDLLEKAPGSVVAEAGSDEAVKRVNSVSDGPVAPTPIHLTPLVWNALHGINDRINNALRPMSDEQAFGEPDYWTLPISDGRAVGNCKHFALEKRKALVESGFSADALSLAIVKTPWGEIHAILVVATDAGDYVLDNLTAEIKGWKDVRYTWIERQTPGQPLRWASVVVNTTG